MSKSRCRHGNVICYMCVEITDAARRMADAIKLACVFRSWEERANGWMAFKLEDGSTDHVIYPSKTEAIQHQSNEFLCCYICLRNCPAGMPEKDAQIMLEYQRYCFDQGLPLVDPHNSLIFPIAKGGGFHG